MRVLYVINELDLGGVETQVARIAPAMKALGIDIEISLVDRKGELIGTVEAAGISVYGRTQSAFGRGENPFHVAAVLSRAINDTRRLIRQRRYDVVHSYLFLADAVAVPAARLAGCKRIIVSRQSMHEWLHPHNIFFHAWEQANNLLAHEMIANSRAVLRDVEAHEPMVPRVRGVIYSGIDVEQYEPARPTRMGPMRVVVVGALAPRKGQEYAIEALRMLTDEGVDVSVELVGDGPDRDMLRHKAVQCGVETSLIFRGAHMDPRPFLSAADVFLLPSRQEGFSSALLEAMASALPVVATDVGGNGEALIHGEGGLLVPPEQPKAIADAIRELARNRSNLSEMGNSNRQRVRELFSLDKSARRLADWYLRGPDSSRSSQIS
jgi:glycosyltransferase involved in cell wall biosynthesis